MVLFGILVFQKNWFSTQFLNLVLIFFEVNTNSLNSLNLILTIHYQN